MQDKIETISNEISIVIYDNPLPPKYIKLKKKFIKQTLVYIPLFLIFSFTSLFFWGFYRKNQELKHQSIPVENNLDESLSVKNFKIEIEEIKKINQELTEKISKQSISSPDEPFLLGIKRPFGMQNLIASNSVSVDQFNFEIISNQINLKFQILSTIPETKIMGHVHVVLVSEHGTQYYPFQPSSILNEGIKFSAGEPFSVSRLRPTNAVFNLKQIPQEMYFIIYIFNRVGDLLLVNKTESFKAGSNK